jgi:predicted RNA-binding Zn-ribbon protein involved in translation (DUF1610 family)
MTAMKLQRLFRPIAKPVLALLAQYFVLRAEHQDALSRQREQTRLAESNAIERSKEHVAASVQRTDSAWRLAEERTLALEARSEALEARSAALEARSAALERGAGWNRQALHDLACQAIGYAGDPIARPADVGVIVPTCDRPALLERALRSIALQTRRPEIVAVVNDGAADVSAVLNRFSSRLRIIALKTPALYSGSSTARNVALNAIGTSLVAFLDDDNVMWHRWIEHATQFFERDPALSIVYGAQLRDIEASMVDKQWFLEFFDLERLRRSNFIDLNQIMHRSTDVRFNPDLMRLIDWDYVLNLIGESPDRIAPVNAISSIYSTGRHDRITVNHWPPDLGEIIACRCVGESLRLPSKHYACSCCGYAGEFLPGPRQRPSAACPKCGSLERHRFLQLIGPMIRSFWIPETRSHQTTSMIEIAPSHATRPFRELFGVATTFDADPAADGRVVDVVASLTHLPMAADAVDVALVLHVLEHVPDDRRAMAEIVRALRPTGVAVLQVPLSGRPATDEEILPSAEERSARYGQSDHVRLYGDDFIARLESAGLTSIAVSPLESMPSEAIRKYGLLPDESLVFAVRTDCAVACDRLSFFASELCKGRL